jgi:transcription elongation factor Elf1
MLSKEKRKEIEKNIIKALPFNRTCPVCNNSLFYIKEKEGSTVSVCTTCGEEFN